MSVLREEGDQSMSSQIEEADAFEAVEEESPWGVPLPPKSPASNHSIPVSSPPNPTVPKTDSASSSESSASSKNEKVDGINSRKEKKSRTNFTIFGIISIGLAAISLFGKTSAGMSQPHGMALFMGILAAMFFTLSRTEKEDKYLFGGKMKKKVFVAICLVSGFVLLVVFQQSA